MALPVASPKHKTGVNVGETVNALPGWVTVAVRVIEQLFSSVIKTEYVPAGKLDAVALVWAGIVVQIKLYGPVPPVGVTVAEPFEPPKQFTVVV